jgi:hypothetical protein
MVDRTPSSAALVEAGAPMWAQRLGLRLVKTFLNLFPTAPVRLWSVTFANLPPAADWPGAIVYVSDKSKVGVSTGSAWVAADGGPL